MKPFRRSLTLWLGLPGLIFLLGEWYDSQAHTSVCTAYRIIDGSVAIPIGVSHSHSTVSIRWLGRLEMAKDSTVSSGPWQFLWIVNTTSESFFPKPSYDVYPPSVSVRGAQVSSAEMEIPHW
ncbi:MAG: hypothetical protein CFE26_13290, partial [Verrucomicrobiales bacterium VVV1]